MDQNYEFTETCEPQATDGSIEKTSRQGNEQLFPKNLSTVEFNDCFGAFSRNSSCAHFALLFAPRFPHDNSNPHCSRDSRLDGCTRGSHFLGSAPSMPLSVHRPTERPYLAELLEIEPEEVEVTTPFNRYGLDSSAAVVLAGDLEDWLGRKIEPNLLYNYPTIEALVQHLSR